MFSADHKHKLQNLFQRSFIHREGDGGNLNPSDLGSQKIIATLLPQSHSGPQQKPFSLKEKCRGALQLVPSPFIWRWHRGGILSCTGRWPPCSSLFKVTAWRSRCLLPEMKPWMKTKGFGFWYRAFLTVTSFQGQLNAKHRSVKFSGNFSCMRHQVKDNFSFRAAFISCFETVSAFYSSAAFVWNNIA